MKNFGNVFILGDSYSTFEGAIPEGNAVYYTPGFKGVETAEQTWWGRLISETGSNLVLNDSSSGTTVCNTGYGGYCPDASFIGRLDKHIKNGFFEKNKVDSFWIFGGTNDFWANSPRGENIRENQTDEDLRAVNPAFHYLLNRIAECVKGAEVTMIVNTDFSETFKSILINTAAEHGVRCVVLNNIEKDEGHPTVNGMAQIADQMMKAL